MTFLNYDKYGDKFLSLSCVNLRYNCIVDFQRMAEVAAAVATLVPPQAVLLHRPVARRHAEEAAHGVLHQTPAVAAREGQRDVVDPPAAPAAVVVRAEETAEIADPLSDEVLGLLDGIPAVAAEEAGESTGFLLKQTPLQVGDGRHDLAEAASSEA